MRVVPGPVVVVVVAAFDGGCFDPTLPEPLPPIACFVDDDCPGLLSCVDHLCAGADDDRRAPGIVADSVVVEPRIAGPGDTITVAFRTDEPVSGVPVVVGGEDAILFSGGSSGEDVFAYAGTVGAIEDGALAVTATLQDAAGNVGDAVLGVVVVDTTAPSVVSFSEPERIAVGAPFVLSFAADEALGGARCALRDLGFGGGNVDVDAVVTGAAASCTVTLQSVVGASFEVDLSMTDTAGNTRRVDSVATLVVTQ